MKSLLQSHDKTICERAQVDHFVNKYSPESDALVLVIHLAQGPGACKTGRTRYVAYLKMVIP